MSINQNKLGWWCAISAYLCWGLFPIYWRLLSAINVWELLCYRIVFSAVPLLAILLITKQYKALINVLELPAQLKIYLISAVFIALNWGLFIWGISEKRVLECSLGYFISPLCQVALGVLLLKENIRPAARISILIVCLALASLLIFQRRLPLLSISLGLTFAIYGFLRKCGKLNSWQGLAVETFLLFFPALLGLFAISQHSGLSWLVAVPNVRILVLSVGFVTMIPLIFYASATHRLPLSIIGILQYLTPCLQFAIGLYVFHEQPAPGLNLVFPVIWVALFIFAFDQWLYASRGNRDIISMNRI